MNFAVRINGRVELLVKFFILLHVTNLNCLEIYPNYRVLTYHLNQGLYSTLAFLFYLFFQKVSALQILEDYVYFFKSILFDSDSLT
ncbi:hypothetical protein MNBD_GAMMA09-3225 [hydrothermal vent metagenome]|uniref:Uncharacterized protein n=1 Tax=hydrothermal vent metagenome TaxID=652676 RepID=A0A3B0XNL7_9ZZZZ